MMTPEDFRSENPGLAPYARLNATELSFWLGFLMGQATSARSYVPPRRTAKLAAQARIAAERSEASPIPKTDHDKAKARLEPWTRPLES